jgi:hypothetical protein
MADFTLGVCATSCKKIGSCCSIEYCELAMETGKQQGVNYEPTGNKKLPMLDTATNTCIVAPNHHNNLFKNILKNIIVEILLLMY